MMSFRRTRPRGIPRGGSRKWSQEGRGVAVRRTPVWNPAWHYDSLAKRAGSRQDTSSRTGGRKRRLTRRTNRVGPRRSRWDRVGLRTLARVATRRLAYMPAERSAERARRAVPDAFGDL